jgi:hypothetical protein
VPRPCLHQPAGAGHAKPPGSTWCPDSLAFSPGTRATDASPDRYISFQLPLCNKSIWPRFKFCTGAGTARTWWLSRQCGRCSARFHRPPRRCLLPPRPRRQRRTPATPGVPAVQQLLSRITMIKQVAPSALQSAMAASGRFGCACYVFRLGLASRPGNELKECARRPLAQTVQSSEPTLASLCLCNRHPERSC